MTTWTSCGEHESRQSSGWFAALGEDSPADDEQRRTDDHQAPADEQQQHMWRQRPENGD
jgi:hypothetical protein